MAAVWREGRGEAASPSCRQFQLTAPVARTTTVLITKLLLQDQFNYCEGGKVWNVVPSVSSRETL